MIKISMGSSFAELYLEGDPEGITPVPGMAYLGLIYVDPKKRGIGLGAILLELCVWTAEKSGKGLCLDASPFEEPEKADREQAVARLCGWYQKRGFAPVPGQPFCFFKSQPEQDQGDNNGIRKPRHGIFDGPRHPLRARANGGLDHRHHQRPKVQARTRDARTSG